jgi:hypothetical protein
MTTIATATFEDLAYVASWMCPMDRRELAVTRDPDDYVRLARDAFATKIHKVALNAAGTPVFAFGAQPIDKHTVSVWGFKTRHGQSVARTVTKYLLQKIIPDLRDTGISRAICYVHPDNAVSRRWLAHLGFRPLATPGELGTPLIKYQRDEPVERPA